MTVKEAIDKIDQLKPNAFSEEEKVAWLSELDGLVQREIFAGRGDSAADFTGYDAGTPGTTPLLVPEPYTAVYLHWLESKIDYWNGELNKYNNASAMFNLAYQRFADAWVAEHKAVKQKWKFK